MGEYVVAGILMSGPSGSARRVAFFLSGPARSVPAGLGMGSTWWAVARPAAPCSGVRTDRSSLQRVAHLSGWHTIWRDGNFVDSPRVAIAGPLDSLRTAPVTDPTTSTRAGYVTLVGRPNAGKSTLMNALIGEHLSIVTPKAQTTWQRVTGILTTETAQFVFLDTPGLLEARDLLQKSMLGAALSALAEADVVLVVIDARYPPSESDHRRLLDAMSDIRAPMHVALNKMDAAEEQAVDAWRMWVAGHWPSAQRHEISAANGDGLDGLAKALDASLPESPFLYPEDEIASQPVRFFVEELVRETVFELYHEEIPYSVVCRVGEFREHQDPVYIQVDVHVERKSQKGILIGKGGTAIRELGANARQKIEHFIGRPVYLDLWVKPLMGWRMDRKTLGALGYLVPDVEEDGCRKAGPGGRAELGGESPPRWLVVCSCT